MPAEKVRRKISGGEPARRAPVAAAQVACARPIPRTDMTTPAHQGSDENQGGKLVCRWCGREHVAIALAPGERAMCARCGTVLQKRGYLGADASLAFALT